jgi:malate synthase
MLHQTSYSSRAGLAIADGLLRFLEDKVLPDTRLDPSEFWSGAAHILERFAPENQVLLARRDAVQARLDDWHRVRAGRPIDPEEYQSFLQEIGYLVDEPAPFTIGTTNVDDEVARLAGPQLVVPALNARFVLNAANSRWGSLYDALYGTDALPWAPSEATSGYDQARGDRVIEGARAFLDQAVPLAEGSHGDVTGWQIEDGLLFPRLRSPGAFIGYRGDPSDPSAILLRNNGLHIELVIDRNHAIGRNDPAGLADVQLEAALTTIVDLEDSVAAVDAEDKVAAYANWLGLMRGDLETTFEKGGRTLSRSLEPDREYLGPHGSSVILPGRSLLFVRNVGHLMTNPSVRLADGSEAPEGILDGIITSLIGLHDLRGLGRFSNSRTGAIYIVKPKMHGPEEVGFTNRLFDAIEDLIGVPRYSVKVGVMDEERRTSANLAACIEAVKNRIVFINTGFLDRTGDEIHTSMLAGPMIPKAEMKGSDWIKAYEDRNVRIGLKHGFSGRAQIGKGMWAAPDKMGDMLKEKVSHPKAGASTAWVPSPTAATLHAMHYHQIDVFSVQKGLSGEAIPPLEALLTVPLAEGRNWAPDDIRCELDNNAQGILGYVVRWVDQGIGCSKVPDIHDVGLMEDRATLRISSQHIANWLQHGICTPAEVEAALRRMAERVDAQNAADQSYRPMSASFETSLAFQAARALIFEGAEQPNGYTEPLLHGYRAKAKAP